MSASLAAALYVVVVLVAFMTPLFTLKAVAHTGKYRWLILGFIAWLVSVFCWILLFLNLDQQRPEWFGAGPLDVVNDWAIALCIISAVIGYALSLAHDE